MAIGLATVLSVLVVIAHPDDETLFGGLMHALSHKLNASVDLVCVTNGEGGYAHAGPSEPLYGNLKLSDETVGRKHLPRIRQEELLGSARIVGVRKTFFIDQRDLHSTQDIDDIVNRQWNKELVIEQLQQTIKNGYDFMLVILPSVNSHGHHTASGLLALEAIHRLQTMPSMSNLSLPTIIGGSEYVLTEPPTYPADPLAHVAASAEFRFDLTWKLSNSRVVDYRTILFWMAAEHKSQGGLVTLILSEHDRTYEQYYYFTVNQQRDDSTRLAGVRDLFKQLAEVHRG